MSALVSSRFRENSSCFLTREREADSSSKACEGVVLVLLLKRDLVAAVSAAKYHQVANTLLFRSSRVSHYTGNFRATPHGPRKDAAEGCPSLQQNPTRPNPGRPVYTIDFGNDPAAGSPTATLLRLLLLLAAEY